MYLSSDLIPAHLCICLFINLPYVKSGLTACSCRSSLLLLILPFAFRTWIHASLEQRKHCTLFFDCPCGIFSYPDFTVVSKTICDINYNLDSRKWQANNPFLHHCIRIWNVSPSRVLMMLLHFQIYILFSQLILLISYFQPIPFLQF